MQHPFVALAIVILTLFFSVLRPLARDDGRYINSPLKKWFDGLQSAKGPCCSVTDGIAIADVDWDTDGGNYRVRIEGQWFSVPADAMVTVPNRFGRAVVWPNLFKDKDGKTTIRCFMPGAGI